MAVPNNQCACGSGLSRARCCALNLATLGAPEANRHLLPLEQRAQAAFRQGSKETAERLALDVLELAPGLTGALTVLYELRTAEGNTTAAEALLRRLVVLSPNTFWAVNAIALLLLGKGDVLEAERHARNAVRIAPENPQAHYLMGLVMTEAFRPVVGEYHYRRATELLGRREPAVLTNHALCLKNQGKIAEARALYEEALAAAPDNLHTLLGYARLEEADRNLEPALALLDRAAALAPDNPGVKLLRATVLGRQKDAPAALALLDTLGGARGELGPGEWLEKGRLLDQMERYEEAFAAFTEGKRRLREISGQAWLGDHARQTAARLKNFFISARIRNLPVATTRRDLPQPIFIVGFPRSGTTLLEQMLSAHPAISAGDELPMIPELTGLMPRMLESPLTYPEALAELWMGDHRADLDNLRDHYLRRAQQLGVMQPGRAWFTDKMPLNETHLGLIALLFPESPILHLIRHPLDVVLSVFSNLLTHGNYCSYALDTAAEHYALTMDLVSHYRAELGLRYLPVRYEEIVEKQELSVRRVLDFIGETFDPSCLAFQENRRYARTASYAQVSERLYHRSRYRYRHYRAQLQALVPVLQPAIEQLGYAIEAGFM